MPRIKSLIPRRRDPQTFRGQMRRTVTGDGRRTVRPRPFW